MKDDTILKDRSEGEIAGYRDVLNTIYTFYDAIPIKPNIILQLSICALDLRNIAFATVFAGLSKYTLKISVIYCNHRAKHRIDITGRCFNKKLRFC